MSEIDLPNDPSELSAPKMSELAKHFSPGQSLEVGDRSIKAEETAGPQIIEVTDEDGKRTCSDLRQLPVWAVRDLIEYYAEYADMHGSGINDDDYDDAYSWLEGLMSAARTKFESWSHSSGEHGVTVTSTVGPPRFIVSDGRMEQTYASLDDIPDIDQYIPALVENAKREMEALRRGERRAQVRKRIDEMFKASEALDEEQRQVTIIPFEPVRVVNTEEPTREESERSTPSASIQDAAPSEIHAPGDPEELPGSDVSPGGEASPQPETLVAKHARPVTGAFSSQGTEVGPSDMAFTKFFDPSLAQPAGDAGTTYVFSAELILAINVALTAGRPLLVQGSPGSGKSSIAAAAARVLGWRHYQYAATANTQLRDLLYRFDLTRRSLDAQARLSSEGMPADFSYVEPGVFWWALDPASAERRGAPEGQPPPFKTVDPLAWAKEGSTAGGTVVLVDDVDKTSADLGESLLQVWTAGEFYVEEVGVRIRQPDPHPPSLLVLTVVGERELPLAVKRRCVVFTLPSPDMEQLMQIATAHGLADDRALTLHVADQLRERFQQRAWPLGASDFLDALRATRALGIEPGTSEWQLAVLPQLASEEVLIDQPSIAQPAQTIHHCRVFLCHSSGDKPAVRELYNRLRQEGFDAWLDEEEILPGQNWDVEIRRAVRDADLVIVCLSKGSVGKTGYVQREISMVLDLADEQPEDKIYLIPTKLEECDVPRRLTRWQWVELFEPRGYNRLLSAVWIAAEGLDLPVTAVELEARRSLRAGRYGSSQ